MRRTGQTFTSAVSGTSTSAVTGTPTCTAPSAAADDG